MDPVVISLDQSIMAHRIVRAATPIQAFSLLGYACRNGCKSEVPDNYQSSDSDLIAAIEDSWGKIIGNGKYKFREGQVGPIDDFDLIPEVIRLARELKGFFMPREAVVERVASTVAYAYLLEPKNIEKRQHFMRVQIKKLRITPKVN